jgi:hypothetical protein
MFCPVCKAEYRFGFTKCSDCVVDLVEHLSDDAGAPVEAVGDPEAMDVLWAGVDARTSASIRRVLDAAKIAYKEDSVESQFMPAFRQSIYRIEVRRADHWPAQQCLQGLAGSDAINSKSPSARLDRNSSVLSFLGINRGLFDRGPVGESSRSEAGPEGPDSAPLAENDSEEANSFGDSAQDDLVEDFHPEDATSEVWSGEDQQLAEDFRACLLGVGIGCEVKQENCKSRVFVMPGSEARAREIIREVIDARPPE